MDKNNYKIQIDSKRLKELRKAMRFSQPEIAKMMGISHAAYQKKEVGLFEFKDSEKLMLFDILKMTSEEFDEILYGGMLKTKVGTFNLDGDFQKESKVPVDW